MKTLSIYTKNIIEKPHEDKFKKINGNNPNFQKRVGDTIGGGEILKRIGFRLDNDGFYHLEKSNVEE